MSFVSYAQNGEDVLLWRALHDVQDGFYIDVGANDPEQHSVTKAFYERGWHGINIEPLPSFRAAFLAQRPRDLTLTVAAGAAEGEITLFDVTDVNGWASMDAAVAASHRAEGHSVVEQTVPLRTLAAICREHVRGPVHFLKIDVEGCEGDVLRGMDWSVCRPWVVVVEATLPNSRVSNHASWEALVTDHGYRFCYFDGLNRYYVADEHPQLAERLTVQPNVFDDYISHHLDKAWQRADQLDATLAELNTQLALHQQQHQAREAELEQAILDAQRQTRLAADDTAQVRAELHQADQRARAFEASLHQNAAWAAGLEQQLLAMRASRSWRITAPMRVLLRRGEQSLPRIARRRARSAIRRALAWVLSRPAVRRVTVPLQMRFPTLSLQLKRVLAVVRQDHGLPTHAPDLPYQLRELPQSARQVLADLKRAQQHTEH
ncbi:MAG TPA: FkbM family methyltransferase [Burkholderiaceae bacterium]|nr:FkbM family methyltransferase [Burkholderiaceae bacterium]